MRARNLRCSCCRCRSTWRARGCRRCRSAACHRHGDGERLDDDAARGVDESRSQRSRRRSRRSTGKAAVRLAGGEVLRRRRARRSRCRSSRSGGSSRRRDCRAARRVRFTLAGTLARSARRRRSATARRRTTSRARRARPREHGEGLRSHRDAATRSICARSTARRRSRRSRRDAVVRGRGTELADDAARRSRPTSRRRAGTASRWTRCRCARRVGEWRGERSQKLYARGAHTAGERVGHASGSPADERGELTYAVDVDSLGAFNRWMPKHAGIDDGGRAAAGGGRARVARGRARIRRGSRSDGDGARDRRHAGAAARRERCRSRCRPIRSPGSLYAAGTVRGNLYDFDLARTAARARTWSRAATSCGAFKSEYAWTNARTPQSKLAVGARRRQRERDGVRVRHACSARVTYATPGGHVELAVTQGNNRAVRRERRLRAVSRTARSCGSRT